MDVLSFVSVKQNHTEGNYTLGYGNPGIGESAPDTVSSVRSAEFGPAQTTSPRRSPRLCASTKPAGPVLRSDDPSFTATPTLQARGSFAVGVESRRRPLSTEARQQAGTGSVVEAGTAAPRRQSNSAGLAGCWISWEE